MDAVMMPYILLGVIFGIVGGMGLGGGIVLIPCLTLLFTFTQHEAQGMTLFAYIPMAVFALFSHMRNKTIRLKHALLLTLFGGAGGAGGYFLAAAIENKSLKFIFGIFLLLTAAYRFYESEIKRKRNDKYKGVKPQLPR